MKHFQIWSGRDMVDNPTWSDVNQFLETVRGNLKHLKMEYLNTPVPGTRGLSVEGDDGLYLPLTLCKNSDGTSAVYYYRNLNADDSWVEVAGYDYPTEILTDDFELVISMFKEFYEKGSVSAVNFQYDFSKANRGNRK